MVSLDKAVCRYSDWTCSVNGHWSLSELPLVVKLSHVLATAGLDWWARHFLGSSNTGRSSRPAHVAAEGNSAKMFFEDTVMLNLLLSQYVEMHEHTDKPESKASQSSVLHGLGLQISSLKSVLLYLADVIKRLEFSIVSAM